MVSLFTVSSRQARIVANIRLLWIGILSTTMATTNISARQRVNGQDIYNAIVGKLLFTVGTHQNAFPQLRLVEGFLSEPDGEQECSKKLQILCQHLNELSVNCYIMRHLHHNLSLDVEAFQEGRMPYELEGSYIIIPK